MFAVVKRVQPKQDVTMLPAVHLRPVAALRRRAVAPRHQAAALPVVPRVNAPITISVTTSTAAPYSLAGRY